MLLVLLLVLLLLLLLLLLQTAAAVPTDPARLPTHPSEAYENDVLVALVWVAQNIQCASDPFVGDQQCKEVRFVSHRYVSLMLTNADVNVHKHIVCGTIDGKWPMLSVAVVNLRHSSNHSTEAPARGVLFTECIAVIVFVLCHSWTVTTHLQSNCPTPFDNGVTTALHCISDLNQTIFLNHVLLTYEQAAEGASAEGSTAATAV
jgi:hypothetical protein